MELVAWLRLQGHDAAVVALKESRDGAAHGVPTIFRGVRPSVRGLMRLRRAVRAADVGVAHGSSALPALALACVGTGTPLVYRSIGEPTYWQSTRLRRLRTRLALTRVMRLVALYPAAAANWVELHPSLRGRITVIANAVDPGRLHMASDSERTRARRDLMVPGGRACVAYIGSLSPEKNPLVAVEAARLADLHLLVVGSGSLAATVASRLEEGGLGRVLGTLRDIRPVLTAADILVLSSLTEGQPAVIIESLLAGVPVVATDVGGIRDMIMSSASGLVMPSPPDPNVLARALRQVLRETTYESRARASESMALHTFDVVGPIWVRLLDDVVQGRG